MAVIKNKRELVLRAQGHARADHISQGTYGIGSTNGEVKFKGCAIGCLATPHRQSELRAWFRSLAEGTYQAGKDKIEFGRFDYPDESEDMTARLKVEFGIVPELSRFAEAVFEEFDFHGAAINFIPKFAKALPEGVNITPTMVRTAFWRINQVPKNERIVSSLPQDGLWGLWITAEEAETGLLDWLHSLA